MSESTSTSKLVTVINSGERQDVPKQSKREAFNSNSKIW